MFAPTTKNERKAIFFFLLRQFGYAVPTQQNVGRPTKAAVNVPVKKYFLSEDLAGAAQLQASSTVCCVHWYEIQKRMQLVLGY